MCNPFSVRKNLLKIGPKTVFFRKKKTREWGLWPRPLHGHFTTTIIIYIIPDFEAGRLQLWRLDLEAPSCLSPNSTLILNISQHSRDAICTRRKIQDHVTRHKIKDLTQDLVTSHKIKDLTQDLVTRHKIQDLIQDVFTRYKIWRLPAVSTFKQYFPRCNNCTRQNKFHSCFQHFSRCKDATNIHISSCYSITFTHWAV